MQVEVAFTSSGLSAIRNIPAKSIVVIDVLRATSTIAAALNSGCKYIIPVETTEEADDLYEKCDKTSTLITGERFCRKIEGYDLGNSPFSFTPELVKDKVIIFTTTNGTKSLKRAEEGKITIAGSLLNASSVVKKLIEFKRDIVLLCAGRYDLPAGDDTFCAGLMVSLLKQNTPEIELSDSADIAKTYYETYKSNPFELFKKTASGQNLILENLEQDIHDCLEVDKFQVVPVYKNGIITGI